LGVVGEKVDLFESEIFKNLRHDAVLPRIGGKSELLVCFYGVAPLILQAVSVYFVQQPDIAPLLTMVDDHSAVCGDKFKRQIKLVLAVAL
jgi:hypothetical protein